MEKGRKLRLGLPAGSLQEATVELFKKAGYRLNIRQRSYYPEIDDPEISPLLLRAQEISRYVEQGALDAGLTGKDWIAENRSDVHVVTDLKYNKRTANPARWVLAVPENSPIKSLKDLQGKRIATELVGAVRHYLAERGIEAQVEFSWGATEVKAPRLVDAIVDITETGSSLKANGLRIVETLIESYPQLIANRESWKDQWIRHKLENLAMMLQGAIIAQAKVGLKMNVHEKSLKAVLDKLPALRKPTISRLSEEGWYALEIIADEDVVRDLIPELKRAGAEGIFEYPLNKLIF
jgi:ATP phosphoribosyltransferase